MIANINNRTLALNTVTTVTLGGRVLGDSRVSFTMPEATLLMDLGAGPVVRRGGFS